MFFGSPAAAAQGGSVGDGEDASLLLTNVVVCAPVEVSTLTDAAPVAALACSSEPAMPASGEDEAVAVAVAITGAAPRATPSSLA